MPEVQYIDQFILFINAVVNHNRRAYKLSDSGIALDRASSTDEVRPASASSSPRSMAVEISAVTPPAMLPGSH